MGMVRIEERTAAPFAGCKVNREAGYIDDVLICGLTSANGRDYPDAVHARDFAAYEGRPVNCDHGREATVDRRLGWFTDVKAAPGSGSRGRFNLLKSHPMYERAMEAAERNPALFGLSHVAMCETTRRNGRDVVESIKSVESIDLVADPATTRGFFESKGNAVPQISLKKFGERFGPKWGPVKWGAFTTFCEAIGKVAEADVMDDPATDTDGDLKAALMAALTPLLTEAFDSGDGTKAAAALKDFVKMHAKHTGKDEPATTETPPEGDGKKESKAQAVNPWDVLTECAAEGYAAGPAELKVIAMLPTPAERKAFILEQKAKRPGEPTRSAGRLPGSGDAGGSGKPVVESAPPADGKQFSEYLKKA